jgi:hypothetical protein
MHPTNPATGLPMTGNDYAGVDVGGNPYGTSWNSHHPWSSSLWECEDWTQF